jgi:hypothetical protein
MLKKRTMVVVGLRLPSDIVVKAKMLADQQGLKVSEVYRHAINLFFDSNVNKKDTNMSTNKDNYES